MKMAKASNEDMEMAFELQRSLEVISGGYPTMPIEIAKAGEDEEEYFDTSDQQQLERFVDYLRGLTRRGSLMRVVFGMSVILDENNKIIDPDDDCLAHHPDRIEFAKAKTLRPLDEWHEDYGPVLWWSLPIVEPPYVGWPLDSDWLDAYTHWTPLIEPEIESD